MRRATAISFALIVGAGACVFAATSLLGGGTVRGRVTGGREAAAVSPQPGHRRPGVSFAAVGDTMLGNTPELPADPGSYLDHVKG